jgi:phosphatidylglycerol---prolipoprotein diacylglyceryl transferase
MFSVIYWDPSRIFFTLPLVNIPIYWYGVFFALGFIAAYYIFIFLLERYFTERSAPFVAEEIVSCSLLYQKMKALPQFAPRSEDAKHLVYQLNLALCNGMTRKSIINDLEPALVSTRKKAQKWADRFSIWAVAAVIIGARLGHLFFYEPPSYYLQNPSIIFMTWKGGLASHGAVAALFVSIALYAKKKKILLRDLLDLLAIPAAFASGMIRLGNFFNQEILGTPSTLPWSVFFARPFDGSMPRSCHPAQMYESLFYIFIGLVLYLTYKRPFFRYPGKRFGFFLTSIFSFRFIVEFFKHKQSLLYEGFFSMGQLLSLPFICIGLYFLWQSSKDKDLPMEKKTV